jgi:Lrp/AsnC family leucine-responsive transcriptional regulator
MKLDAIDRRILAALSENGRMSTLEVAQKVGLSPTPCGRRIRLLEEAGVITGYTAIIDPAALDMNVCVIISVRLATHAPDSHQLFLDAIKDRPEVTECMLVTGSSDYLLRVWVKDISSLADFVPTVLQGIPSVVETSTTVVLRQHKNTVLPTSQSSSKRRK